MKGIETLKKVIAQHRYKDAELLLAARMEKLAGAKGRNKRFERDECIELVNLVIDNAEILGVGIKDYLEIRDYLISQIEVR
jgi:hypothetical protein